MPLPDPQALARVTTPRASAPIDPALMARAVELRAAHGYGSRSLAIALGVPPVVAKRITSRLRREEKQRRPA